MVGDAIWCGLIRAQPVMAVQVRGIVCQALGGRFDGRTHGTHCEGRSPVGEIRSQSRSEIARAAGQPTCGHGAASGTHLAHSAHDLPGTQQHRRGRPVRAAHHIDAPMNAVGEVDVHVTGWAEHHRAARGGSACRVRCRVVNAQVGLDLGESYPHRTVHDRRPEQTWCHPIGCLGQVQPSALPQGAWPGMSWPCHVAWPRHAS